MVYIEGLNELNETVSFGFWTGTGNKSVDVVSGQTWSLVERDFAGNGRMLSFDNFGSVIGLESRSITVRLAGSDSLVEDMIRGYNLRRAPAELLMAHFDPETHVMVSDPYPVFVGQVDTAKIRAQGSNVAEVRIVSDTISLTLTNQAKKSHAQQVLDDNDDFRQYSDLAGKIEIWWGEYKKKVQR